MGGANMSRAKVEPTTVFIVEEVLPYEGSEIRGVATTLNLAKEVAERSKTGLMAHPRTAWKDHHDNQGEWLYATWGKTDARPMTEYLVITQHDVRSS